MTSHPITASLTDPAAPFPQPVKVIIWDLDDTFWRGTLTEGGIEAIADNLALVRDTAARGLVHTIVSKNDLAPVEEQLTALGIRDLFVFPRVSWQPKGPIIRDLLEQMQLRAPNALFIDDNSANRQEALFYNPGLQVADPADLPALAPALRELGKPDPGYTRLEQYRVLERQQQARATYGADNLAFLRDAGLRIEFREGAAAAPDAARIEELINRSNQLNYTKRRVTRAEVEAALADPARRWGTVRVRDRFGDYGLVGVYGLDPTTNRLDQLVFSCRTLHLGVEQFTYAHLGFPQLEVAGEVTTQLSPTDTPDWLTITEAGAASEQAGSSPDTGRPPSPSGEGSVRLLLKGGCDLGQLTPYLQAYDLTVDEEFNFVNEHQIPVHVEHTALLRLGRELPAPERARLSRELPFLGAEAFDTRLWDGAAYDALVYSPLMDYTQDLYRERATGYRIPFGGYRDLTTLDPAAEAARLAARRFQGMDEAFLRRFREQFAYEGPLSPTEFTHNLAWLRAQVPAATPIFFLTGAEVEVPGSGETGSAARHQQMNAALEAFVATAPSCFMVDVRAFVRAPADVTNNARHYQRPHYRALAQQVVEAVAAWRGHKPALSAWADWRARLAARVPAKVRGAWQKLVG